MNHTHALIPAAYVFLVRGGRVLLQLRHNTGYADGHWSAGAAGHVEAGEDALDAAVREAREELGVLVDRSALEPLAVMQRTDGTDDPREQRVDWMFTAARWTGEPTIIEPAKCAALRWFSPDDWPTLMPHERLALDHLTGHRPALLFTGY